jgi:hypothetical protein
MPSVFRSRVLLAVLALFVVGALGACTPSPGRTSTRGGGRNGATNGSAFGIPHYFSGVTDDTFYNTVGADGSVLSTANDSTGVNNSCTVYGRDIAILKMRGPDPAHFRVSTVNCMNSYGPRGGGTNPDGCSWKSGGITRIGDVVYLVVARQLHQCSAGRQANGLQPSFDASIIKSIDGGKTWTNPWGVTSRDGAAPAWLPGRHRYRAMFRGRRFSAPFFVQYGPGNTHTVDGAGKYLYAVSTDGYTYNGSYLILGRVRLDKIQQARAWQYYHGGAGRRWTSSPTGATHVLRAPHELSQPAIQYVPALKRYVLLSASFTRAGTDFPTPAETPYTRFHFYTAPKLWGPWTKVYDHSGRRSIWCSASPCPLTEQPGASGLDIGTPHDWLGLYDPALVQKFVFTRPLSRQAVFTTGDWKNATRYPGEHLNRLLVLPFDLSALAR